MNHSCSNRAFPARQDSAADAARGTAAGRIAILVGLAALTLWSLLTLHFSDVTIHGPDQIRDIAVARRLVQDGIFPLDSPAFTDIYTMPPGVYYLLAFPLFVLDREESVFLAFGLLFLASQWWLWKVVLDKYGAGVSALFAATSTPFLSHLFVHSAWHNGLILTITSAYLALLIQATSGSRRAWGGSVAALFLAVQISPSIAPHGVSFLAAARRHRSTALNRWSVAAGAISLAAVAAWASLTQHPFAAKDSAHTASHIRNRFVLDPERLFDPGKWWDFFSFPARIAEALVPMPYSTLVWGALILPLAGLGYTCIARFARGVDASTRTLVDALLVWLAIAALTLPTGIFYYAYAITPLIAILSSLGLHAMLKRRAPRYASIVLAGVLLAGSFVPQLKLHATLAKEGVLMIDTSALTFPVLPKPASQIPFVSARTQLSLFRFLDAHGICPDQVAGAAFLILNDVSLRGLSRHCESAAQAPAYYLSHPLFNEPPQTEGAQARMWADAGYALFSVPKSAAVGAAGRTTETSTDKLNYSTFRPAGWSDGAPITLRAAGPQVLRISLRCTSKTLRLDDASWVQEQIRVAGAEIAGSPRMRRYDILWHDYVELELQLDVGSAGPATLTVGHGELACDVGAIATNPKQP